VHKNTTLNHPICTLKRKSVLYNVTGATLCCDEHSRCITSVIFWSNV